MAERPMEEDDGRRFWPQTGSDQFETLREIGGLDRPECEDPLTHTARRGPVQQKRLGAAALDVVTAVSDRALRRRQTFSAQIPYAYLLELEAALEDIEPGIVAACRKLQANEGLV